MGVLIPCVIVHILSAVALILLILLKIDKRRVYIAGYKDKEGNFHVNRDDGKYTKIWYDFCKRKKKVNIVYPLLVLLLFLAIAAIYFYFGFQRYQGLPFYLSKNSTESGEDLLYRWLLPVVLSVSALTWFFHWGSLSFHYLRATCGCRSVMSRKQIETKDCSFSEWTQEKTKDGYGTVGSVYVNNNKVGDIKGSTTYTVTRKGHTLRWISVCQCCYCGNKFEKEERKVEYSLWR